MSNIKEKANNFWGEHKSTIKKVGVGIGIVICVYILVDKRALGRRFTKLLGLIFKEEMKEKVIKLGKTITIIGVIYERT
mgnify:CR=1 FL=1